LKTPVAELGSSCSTPHSFSSPPQKLAYVRIQIHVGELVCQWNEQGDHCILENHKFASQSPLCIGPVNILLAYGVLQHPETEPGVP